MLLLDFLQNGGEGTDLWKRLADLAVCEHPMLWVVVKRVGWQIGTREWGWVVRGVQKWPEKDRSEEWERKTKGEKRERGQWREGGCSGGSGARWFMPHLIYQSWTREPSMELVERDKTGGIKINKIYRCLKIKEGRRGEGQWRLLTWVIFLFLVKNRGWALRYLPKFDLWPSFGQVKACCSIRELLHLHLWKFGYQTSLSCQPKNSESEDLSQNARIFIVHKIIF